MKVRHIFIIDLIGMLLVTHASATEIVLANSGQSAYQIVLADAASPSTRHGAEELQTFLQQMTGAKLPIVSDRQPLEAKEIILGNNSHLQKLDLPIDFAAMGKEGYVIRTVGERVVIAGGQLRGNMYGVYGFLEDHLGCRWFSPGVSRIPKSARLTISTINDCQIPVLEYREPYMYGCFDGDWCARNRMNSSHGQLEKQHGGKMSYANGFVNHTFERLIPQEKYFDKHPEYFALVQGYRQKEHRVLPSQLCCTNPDVIRICTEEVREAMRTQPGAMVFSVSQNDSFGANYCECSNCQALTRKEESQMAPVLQLVNSVAKALEEEFPDKMVHTLAYKWTRKPPKTMRPRSNVVVMLCSIECCFSHTLEGCDSEINQAFCADLDAWSKITSRLWMWDYAANYGHYLLPFPSMRQRGLNIRFFVANNIKGIFEEGVAETADGELVALRGYMIAKFLWNQSYDADKAMDEFLDGYYGKAAAPIRAYIDLLHDHVERKNIHVRLWATPFSPHVDDDLLAKSNELWEQAEKSSASEPEVLDRVQRSRMSVDYAILERARLHSQKKIMASETLLKLSAARIKPFCKVLHRSKLTCLESGVQIDKAVYCRDLAGDLLPDVR